MLIGGFGSIYGAIIGAFLIGFLLDIVKFIQTTIGIGGGDDVKIIIYGLVILSFIVFEPNGFYGRWRIVRAYLKAFPLNEVQKKRIAWIRRWK